MPPVSDVIPDLSYRCIDSGRYQLLEPLGAGTYGVVYRARERIPNTHKVVPRAIKVVLRAPSKSTRASLQNREAWLHSRICDHPNVVTLHRVLRDAYFVYYVMDHCSGGDLYRVIRRKDVFPKNDNLVRHLFLQILDGVESFHKKGVFHRDLKPENIFLSSDYAHAYIGDFGLATEMKQSTSFNTGSKYYMSPECVDCDDELYPYDTRRSDIWALGLILLMLVTGRLPWRRATIEDPIFVRYLENPNYLRTILPVSASLNNLLHKVFTIRPEDSISVAEFRREVRNMKTFWMTDEEVSASSGAVQLLWTSYARRLQQQRQDSSSSEDSGDVLESDTCSESTDVGEHHSRTAEDDSGQLEFAATQALRNAEEGRSRDVPPPSNVVHIEPQIDPHMVVCPMAIPVPHVVSSDEFPLRSPACGQNGDDPIASSPSASEGPVTPETHAQNPSDIVIAEPLDDTALRVEQTAVARVEESDRDDKKDTGRRRLSDVIRYLLNGLDSSL